VLVTGAVAWLVLREDGPEPGALAGPSPSPFPTASPVAEESDEPSALEPETIRGNLAAVSHDRYLTVYKRPRDGAPEKVLLDTVNPFGQRLAMLVGEALARDGKREWLRIHLPIRPNGSMGWVRAEDVRVVTRSERLVVDLSARTMKLFRDGEHVRTYSVGVGRPEYPTATGTFYVWAKVPQASATGPYGIYALGISGFSPVLSDWPGGGRMAVHGTANPDDRGNAVSHGCVRVHNDEMRDLTGLKMGTPVIIRA
jgi:hypothetical protein